MFYFFDVVSVLGEFMLVFDQFYIEFFIIDKFLIDKFYQYRLVSFNISILDIQVV